ncbi:hypothetical protein Acor_58250 [Acrocarpospora corrugata]|uniref:Transposase IS110-like N-terminal domain-containing protein n=1 Tax=Acrocarpospora corrugata TaxID=35763 RepID=A0A5M3W633_9ACTN|nr:hypothetical protein Acor_58250 [Acrocarpospora corrugata]
MLVVVDQPASIGALPVAVARAEGCQVAYLPGLTMRRLADLRPGNAKTDARDAFIIADAARTLPHTLRRVGTGDEALSELEVLVGFDDDLAGEATRVTNRIRGLLVTIHPALERAFGPRLHHPAALELLARFGGPDGLRAAGHDQLLAVAQPLAHAWPLAWWPMSWRRSMPRPSSSRAPRRPRRCCHAWPARYEACSTSANKSPPKSRSCSNNTLSPRS